MLMNKLRLLSVILFLLFANNSFAFNTQRGLSKGHVVYKLANTSIPSTYKYKLAINTLKDDVAPRLTKYMHRHIKNIYIVEYMEPKYIGAGNEICGTYYNSDIVLSVSQRCKIKNIGYYAVHEFSSIIYKKYKSEFPFNKWRRANKYPYRSDKKWDIISAGQNYLSKTVSRSRGFWKPYSMVSVEEDYNVLIGYYYQDHHKLMKNIKKYPIIESKLKLANKFFIKHRNSSQP